MRKKIKSYFYGGLISLLPVILTVYIFAWIFNIFISILRSSFVTTWIRDIFEYFGESSEVVHYMDWAIYALSALTMVIVITLVGYTMRIILFAKIANIFKEIFIKIPLVKHIYSTISQILSLFSSDKGKSYQRVVLLEYPRKGVYSLGFLTSESNPLVGEVCELESVCNVFIPTSPNPTSGMFVMVPKEDVVMLDMKIDDAIKLIISGGVILPEKRS
ncbi:DUF502 domain-containing protein [Cetobacterium sp. SF1]|uniref:DUF502 domain-containing protein n=1 Tax=unclassified Cetobacterium TaxID=2630983 RepID=UPI003CF83DE1